MSDTVMLFAMMPTRGSERAAQLQVAARVLGRRSGPFGALTEDGAERPVGEVRVLAEDDVRGDSGEQAERGRGEMPRDRAAKQRRELLGQPEQERLHRTRPTRRVDEVVSAGAEAIEVADGVFGATERSRGREVGRRGAVKRAESADVGAGGASQAELRARE
jgi:hypothetical protein